jgi:hypothetical protein
MLNQIMDLCPKGLVSFCLRKGRKRLGAGVPKMSIFVFDFDFVSMQIVFI